MIKPLELVRADCVLIATYAQSLLALAFGVGGVLYTVLSELFKYFAGVYRRALCHKSASTNKE